MTDSNDSPPGKADREKNIQSSSREYSSVTLTTQRGEVACRYYPVAGTRRGALWVGGVGGGWDTPARGLYPRLCQELVRDGVASLRVRYRHPTILEEALSDVRTGLSYLASAGLDSVALIGHSFGGAVVIQAAAHSPIARTVVTIATQGSGAAPASLLAPRCSILLLHGTDDQVLPPYSSEYVYHLARGPKRLVLHQKADHSLDAVATEVRQLVHTWIVEQLNR